MKQELYPIDKKTIPPYMSALGGFGYQGVLLYEPISDMVQCHICGELFESLGQHIKWKHKITTRTYREEFGLLVDTKLCNNEIKEKRSKRAVEYYEKYRKNEKKLINKKGTGGNGRNINNLSMEEMNKHGNCPLQIETRFDEIADKLGKTPTKRDIPYSLFKAIIHRFGTYNEYLKYRGYKINKYWRQYNKKELLDILREYKKSHGILPVISDFRSNRVNKLISIRPYQQIFGSFQKAKEMIK